MSKLAEIWGYDPKKLITELIDHLIKAPGPARIIDVELADPNAAAEEAAGRRPVLGDITAKEADDINIAAGKEDLAEAATLFDVLDAIPHIDDRHRAYDALYRILNGTFLIAKSAIDPLNEEQRARHKQLAWMRTIRAKKLTTRDQIVLSMRDENKKRAKPLSIKVLIHEANKQLVAAGEEEIDERKYHRICAKGARKNI